MQAAAVLNQRTLAGWRSKHAQQAGPAGRLPRSAEGFCASLAWSAGGSCASGVQADLVCRGLLCSMLVLQGTGFLASGGSTHKHR